MLVFWFCFFFGFVFVNHLRILYLKKVFWHECFGNEDCVGQTEGARLLTVFISDRKLVCPQQMSELPLRALTVHIVFSIQLICAIAS